MFVSYFEVRVNSSFVPYMLVSAFCRLQNKLKYLSIYCGVSNEILYRSSYFSNVNLVFINKQFFSSCSTPSTRPATDSCHPSWPRWSPSNRCRRRSRVMTTSKSRSRCSPASQRSPPSSKQRPHRSQQRRFWLRRQLLPSQQRRFKRQRQFRQLHPVCSLHHLLLLLIIDGRYLLLVSLF